VEDLKKGISKPLKEMNFSSGDEDASINSNYPMSSGSTASLFYNKRNSIGNRDEDDEDEFDDDDDDDDDDPIS
jgi:hypothetical protein